MLLITTKRRTGSTKEEKETKKAMASDMVILLVGGDAAMMILNDTELTNKERNCNKKEHMIGFDRKKKQQARRWLVCWLYGRSVSSHRRS